ncbi:FkbM family methyltransferase [Streptomyces pinistramenti]|uniref:FkbM family methyltransferase n=1 Tax=Streptomyces pinistramenti TaxID=2884812 RepID=UPI001D083D31|nr:FkbM family methyltransferase [Streptomyces pinistramenti]MCB5907505.1 FkbM family methyltransferase [Streptomyces pinistramenti]
MTAPPHDGTETETDRRVAQALRAHTAVADAAVLGPAGNRTAYVVPDPLHAAPLHRAATVEAAGLPAGLEWHEPADELRVAGVNRTESDFLHREIFTDNAYLRHGITLPEDAVVVDVGANIGMFTLHAARHSPRVRVLAVEPVAELAAAATVNAGLYGVDATVLTCALGAEAGGTELTYYPNNSVMSGRYARADEDLPVLRGYLLTGEGGEQGRQLDRLVADRMTAERRHCAVRTLTEVVAHAGLTRIDLLKIDVEKAEADVLAGIDEALWDRIRQIVLEVHDLDGRLAEIVSRLRARGFTVTHDQDPRLALTPCHNVYGRRAGTRPAAPPRTAPPPLATMRALERRLREHLARQAPDLPAPDRFALVPDVGTVSAALAPGVSVPGPAPATPRTAVLSEVWNEIFGPGSDRPDADFFDLGGDSLTAVRLLARLEERLGEEALAPDAIFTDGTFAGLAAAVEASGR